MRSSDPIARHRTHGALAVPSRAQLLDALRAAEHPLTAQELSVSSRLHVSTVRFHLDVLVGAGLVYGRSEPMGRRGRPRMLYYPVVGGPVPPGAAAGYELLAGVLAANWADTSAERAQRAERAGHTAAAAQRILPSVRRTPSMEESVDEITGMFAELGFEPDVVPEGDGVQIRLHACPFRAVAAEHPEVVCSLHLGLLRGSMAETGAPAAVTRLEPFVEPHLCIAHIVRATPAPPTQLADTRGRP